MTSPEAYESPFWTTGERRHRRRCQYCEWHTKTQGHHPNCPAKKED